MTEKVDCVVIGAGVVGLATARALAQAGREVIVVESADMIGTGISSRNSEVIHAGIYYPLDSLKARYCVAGKEMLYRYCAEHGIAHRRCGKIIVATSQDQVAALQDIQQRAAQCGVGDLEMLAAAADACPPQRRRQQNHQHADHLREKPGPWQRPRARGQLERTDDEVSAE